MRAAARDTRRGTRWTGNRPPWRRSWTQARGDAESVAARAAQLERPGRGCSPPPPRPCVPADDTAQRLKDADDRLADAAFRAGFDTPQAAADGRSSTTPTHRDLQHRLDAWQSEEAARAPTVLAEPDTAAAAAAAARRPRGRRAARRGRRAAAARRRLRARRRRAPLRRTGPALRARPPPRYAALGPLREEYDRVARLAGLAAGTSADNERKMRLEAYVLAARLEQVAAAATARLQRMSVRPLHPGPLRRPRRARAQRASDCTSSTPGPAASATRPRSPAARRSSPRSPSPSASPTSSPTRRAAYGWTPSSSTRASAASTSRPSTRSWTSSTRCANATAASASSAMSPTCGAASTPSWRS